MKVGREGSNHLSAFVQPDSPGVFSWEMQLPTVVALVQSSGLWGLEVEIGALERTGLFRGL